MEVSQKISRGGMWGKECGPLRARAVRLQILEELAEEPNLNVSALAVRVDVDQSEGRALASVTGLDGDHVLVVFSADLQFRDRA